MSISSPVRGLRPLVALRSAVTKLPNSGQADFLLALQGLLDHGENRLHSLRRGSLRQIRLFCDRSNEV